MVAADGWGGVATAGRTKWARRDVDDGVLAIERRLWQLSHIVRGGLGVGCAGGGVAVWLGEDWAGLVN